MHLLRCRRPYRWPFFFVDDLWCDPVGKHPSLSMLHRWGTKVFMPLFDGVTKWGTSVMTNYFLCFIERARQVVKDVPTEHGNWWTQLGRYILLPSHWMVRVGNQPPKLPNEAWADWNANVAWRLNSFPTPLHRCHTCSGQCRWQKSADFGAGNHGCAPARRCPTKNMTDRSNVWLFLASWTVGVTKWSDWSLIEW